MVAAQKLIQWCLIILQAKKEILLEHICSVHQAEGFLHTLESGIHNVSLINFYHPDICKGREAVKPQPNCFKTLYNTLVCLFSKDAATLLLILPGMLVQRNMCFILV